MKLIETDQNLRELIQHTRFVVLESSSTGIDSSNSMTIGNNLLLHLIFITRVIMNVVGYLCSRVPVGSRGAYKFGVDVQVGVAMFMDNSRVVFHEDTIGMSYKSSKLEKTLIFLEAKIKIFNLR